MRIAVLVALTPSIAFANADAPEAPPSPPMPHLDRIEGPFATADAYCAFRARQIGNDDGDITLRPEPCAEPETLDLTASPRPGQAIRAYRFVEIDTGLHVVVETSNGWYGRELVSAGMGDSKSIEAARFSDLTGDRDDELSIDVSHSHEPCGCGDLWHKVVETFACTVTNGELQCTDGITTSDDMHLTDIWSWSSTLAIDRDGKAHRTITESERVSKRELRALAAPFRVRFHR